MPELPRATLLVAVLVGAALVACSGERPTLSDEVVTTTESTTTTVPESEGAEVATANATTIDVFAAEGADEPDQQVVAGVDTSDEEIPIVFLVKGRGDDEDRIEVNLPGPPSGGIGWVDADDVSLSEVRYRLEVGLSERRLRVLRDDEIVFDEPVGVGCEDGPTPGGVYYLKELVEPPDPDGRYGTYAYGLSGFVNVLEGATEGELVGIHGTDDPDVVGTDETRGCLPLENDAIERLVEEIGLPLGTPVEVLE
jgi:lipoprotein-anchoring transpeptidase ErfK/SrfK